MDPISTAKLKGADELRRSNHRAGFQQHKQIARATTTRLLLHEQAGGIRITSSIFTRRRATEEDYIQGKVRIMLTARSRLKAEPVYGSFQG